MAGAPTKTVVVIDDDEPFRYAFSRRLQHEGWAAHAAANGREGVELSRTVRPSVIFLDLQMPELDGFETCAQLRAEEWSRRTIIIAVSGLPRYSVEERALRSGFDLYLLKPLGENLIRKILEQTIAGAPPT